jgi:hypothetical protein
MWVFIGTFQESFRSWFVEKLLKRRSNMDRGVGRVSGARGAFFLDSKHDQLLRSVNLDKPELLRLYKRLKLENNVGEITGIKLGTILEDVASVSCADAAKYGEMVVEAFAGKGGHSVSCDTYITFMALKGDDSHEVRLENVCEWDCVCILLQSAWCLNHFINRHNHSHSHSHYSNHTHARTLLTIALPSSDMHRL